MTPEFANKFDVILDASDKDFAAKLMAAIGVKPGEAVNFITPTFNRTDGRIITYRPTTPEEYAALPKLDAESLKKIGCQMWDEADGRTIWLYPAEWYDHIPNGTPVVDIFGNEERFEHGVTDDDRRFGALAFGFAVPTTTA